MTASELNVLKILCRKNSVMSMRDISKKAGFEITYTYMLCKGLERNDYIGFFTRSSCKITAKGKYLVARDLKKDEKKGGKDSLNIKKIEY